MLLRKIQFRASILGISLSSALVMAQDPPPPSPAVDSAYPASNGNDIAAEPIAPDGWNYDWQWRASVDALYFKRNNHSDDLPVIDGPDSFRFHDLSFNRQPGTRLNFALMEGDYEFETIYTTFHDWSASRSGMLTDAVVFDGRMAYDDADQAAKDAIDGIDNFPNVLSSSTFFAPINAAAVSGAEADELEFLVGGARFSQRFNSTMHDLEFNFKQRVQPGRFMRLGFGYRNLYFRELGRTTLAGTFDTIDSATGGEADGNNGLSAASLTGAGLTNFDPVTDTPNLLGLNNGFTANAAVPPADELLFSSILRTSNQLHGVQVTADWMFFESDWVEFGGFTKAGVFHNHADGRVEESYSDTANDLSTYRRQLNDEEDNVAFMAHGGLNSRWFLTDNLRVVAGYEVMYLTGLALAPDVLRGVSPAATAAATLDLRTHGSVFLHGGRIGLEFVY